MATKVQSLGSLHLSKLRMYIVARPTNLCVLTCRSTCESKPLIVLLSVVYVTSPVLLVTIKQLDIMTLDATRYRYRYLLYCVWWYSEEAADRVGRMERYHSPDELELAGTLL